MASAKDFKNRLKSIASVQKITKAMKMVAASKLRLMQRNAELARPMAATMSSFFGNLQVAYPADHAVLFTPISSDKGLCGGVNSNITKLTKKLAAAVSTPAVYCVGEKGKDSFRIHMGKYVVSTASDVSKRLTSFLTASLVAENVLLNPADEYVLVFNRFKSVISQLPASLSIPSYTRLLEASSALDAYEFEGEKDELLLNLLEYYLGVSLYSALLENSTSEQGARMSAMDSASRNASDMLNKLNLEYNKARQAGITQELTEIVSCASAVSE